MTESHTWVEVALVAAARVLDETAKVAGFDAEVRADTDLEQIAGPSVTARRLDVEAAVDVEAAALGIAVLGPDVADSAVWLAPAAGVACDRAGRTGSWAVAAFEDSAFRPTVRRPNCYLQQVEVVLAQEAGSVHVRPIADLADHQVRQADTPAGVHPVVKVHRLGLADRSWVDLSAMPNAL